MPAGAICCCPGIGDGGTDPPGPSLCCYTAGSREFTLQSHGYPFCDSACDTLNCISLLMETEWFGISGGGPITGELCWTGSRFRGTGTAGSLWSAYVSGPTTDANGCKVYTIAKLRVSCAGQIVQWDLQPTDGSGACAAGNWYSVSSNDNTIDDAGCPGFSYSVHGHPIPFREADAPASLDVTIAGVTGTCCTALNGAQTLNFDSATVTDSACINASRGEVNYRKAYSSTISCSGKRIELILLSVGDCTLRVRVIATYNPSAPFPCLIEWSKDYYPQCGTLVINLADLTIGTTGCPVTDCDLSGATLSGTITLG